MYQSTLNSIEKKIIFFRQCLHIFFLSYGEFPAMKLDHFQERNKFKTIKFCHCQEIVESTEAMHVLHVLPLRRTTAHDTTTFTLFSCLTFGEKKQEQDPEESFDGLGGHGATVLQSSCPAAADSRDRSCGSSAVADRRGMARLTPPQLAMGGPCCAGLAHGILTQGGTPHSSLTRYLLSPQPIPNPNHDLVTYLSNLSLLISQGRKEPKEGSILS